MKQVCISVMLLLAANNLCGQSMTDTVKCVEGTDQYKVETNKFWNNWFISVGGGAQIYFGDHNKQMDFSDRLSPALDIAIGKWFTPGIGIRLAYSGLSFKGVTQNMSHSNGEIYDASQDLYKQKFNLAHFHGDVLFNASNLLFGYNEHRFYSLSPYAGLGWMVSWQTPQEREVSANIGLLNSFRLGAAFALNLDLRGSLVNDRFDGEGGGRKEEGAFSATLGLCYKPGRQGWHRGVDRVLTREEMLQMRAKMNGMMAENKKLHEALKAEENVTPREVVASDTARIRLVSPCLITFAIGKSTLTRENRVNLGFLAKVIRKGDPKVVYCITGYADKATGSVQLNRHLSDERAWAVYNCLVDEFHISPSRLKVASQGGVDNMFYNDPSLSRAVIMEAK